MPSTNFEMRKQPKQARSRAIVNVMIDACARVLVEEGYGAVTTNHVAEVAGVSVGSLYEYFPNKQSLVAAVVEAEAHEVLLELSGSMEEAFRLEGDATFRFWIEAMVASLEKRQGMLRALIAEVPFLMQVPILQHLPDMLQAISTVAQQRSASIVRPREPRAAVYHLTTMVGAAILNMALHPPSDIPRDVLLDELTGFVVRLLEPPRGE